MDLFRLVCGLSLMRLVCGLSLMGLVLVLSDYYLDWKKRRALGDIPLILPNNPIHLWTGGKSAANYDDEMTRAYQQYTKKGKLFAHPNMNGSSTIVVFPPQLSKEWCRIPTDHINWPIRITEEYLLKDIGVELNWNITSRTVLICNRSACIKRTQPYVFRAVDAFLLAKFGKEESGSRVPVVDTMMLLSAEITLLLVFRPGFGQGSAPGQSTTLAQHLVSYAIQLEERIFIQRSYPTFLRPFIRRFSHKTRSLKSIIASMKQVIIPEIRRRIAQKRAGQEEEDQDVFYLDVMIELSMKEGYLSRDGHDADPQFLDKMANHLLFICHEMISPLWMVSAMLLFELWSRPEHASPLRRELESALDLTGGQWCLDMFKHTPVLESFTKETLRLNPPSALTSGRQVLKPLDLPSFSHKFRPGAKIGFLPARWAQRDPDNYRDPDTFDAYRFVDPVTGTCDVNGTVTPTEKWLPFAIGASTCPGRLAGVRATQIMFARMLHGYEAKLEGSESQLFMHYDGVTWPNPEVSALVRRRRDGVDGDDGYL